MKAPEIAAALLKLKLQRVAMVAADHILPPIKHVEAWWCEDGLSFLAVWDMGYDLYCFAEVPLASPCTEDEFDASYYAAQFRPA